MNCGWQSTALRRDSLISLIELEKFVPFKELLRTFLLLFCSPSETCSFPLSGLPLPLVVLRGSLAQVTSACRGSCVWSGNTSHHLLWLKFWLPSALFWAQTPSAFSIICPLLETSSFSGARWDRGWIYPWGSAIHDWGWGYTCTLVAIPYCPAVGWQQHLPQSCYPSLLPALPSKCPEHVLLSAGRLAACRLACLSGREAPYLCASEAQVCLCHSHSGPPAGILAEVGLGMGSTGETVCGIIKREQNKTKQCFPSSLFYHLP